MESAPLHGERASAHMFSLQDISSVSERKVSTSSPLFYILPKGEPADFKSVNRSSSSSLDKMGSNIELNVDDFSDERCYKNQEVGSSLASLNCGKKKKQILDRSEGTLSTPSQKVSPSSLRSQPSKGEVLEVEKAKPMTNDQILDFIEKEVALLKSGSRKDDMELQHFSPVLNEQCTTAMGQEDGVKGSKRIELSPKSKEKCDISASEKHLTDYQHVMLEVAATCAKNEAESPVILTAVSGVVLPGEMKYPRLMGSCSSSQGECKRVKETPDTLPLLTKHVKWEREDISLNPVEEVGLGSVIGGNQDVNANKQKNIEDQQYCHVESKEAAALSSLDSSTDKIEIDSTLSFTVNQSEQSVCKQTSYKNMEQDKTGVCLQADLTVPLPLNKVNKITLPCRPEGEETFFVAVLKDPKYEDIADTEDLSMLDVNLLNTKQEEVRFADPSYDDISEDENPQFQNMAEEMPSFPCEVFEANATQYGHVQSWAKMNLNLNKELIPKKQMSSETETLGIAQHCSCPCFVETEDGFERVLCPKCDSDKQLTCQRNRSFIPLSVKQDQDETNEAADEDSEWLVMPIKVLDVKWEPADEDQAGPEKVSQCDNEHEDQVEQGDTNPTVYDVPRSVPNQVPASAFPPMEVFDTPSHQAKAVQSRETLQSFLVPSSWGIPETKAHKPQNRESHCDPEDSCETEDSSDYSSDSERNYLTVSTQLLKNQSVSASPGMDDSDSEKENEDHEVTNLQQCQTRGRSKTSGKADIINLDSDTEDEGVQNCLETVTKRLFSTQTQNSGATCHNQLKKPPETVGGQCRTVKENFQTNGLQSTDSSDSQRQSGCYKEAFQIGNSHLSQRTENCGHLFENKSRSHHVKKESSEQNISDDTSVIVILDSEDEGKQSSRQVKRKGVSSSEPMSGSSISCGEKSRDTVKKESAKTKNREPTMPCADSSKSQHQSKLQHAQLKEKRQDVHSSLSHSIKKRKLIKVRVRPERVHQKANRQTTSKTVERDVEKNLIKNKTNVVSSETEDRDDALVDAQNSLCARKKTQINLSSKDSLEKLPQSVYREVGSTKACHEHVQQKAKRQMNSKPMEKEVEKDLNKQKRKTRILSSETEDSDDTLIYTQTSSPFMDYPQKQPQSVDKEVDSIKVCNEHVEQKASGYMTSKTMDREVERDLIKQKRKTRVLSSETEDSDDALFYAQTSLSTVDMPEKHSQSLDSKDDSTMIPNPVIPRFFVQKSSQSNECLKLLERSTVQRQGRNESGVTPETPAETSKKTDSFKKKKQHSYKGITGKIVSKPKPVGDAHHTTLLPRSVHSSSSPSQCLSSSKLQRSHSYSNTSILNQSCTPTKGPSSSTLVQPSAKEQVFSDWQKSFVPTRRDRKTSLENNLRTRNNCESLRKGRAGPSHHEKAPRWRHSSYESVPPLMKRPKYEAIEITKARNRDTPWEQRISVSEGYKWKNQTSFMTNKRPGKRYSSPPRPHH